LYPDSDNEIITESGARLKDRKKVREELNSKSLYDFLSGIIPDRNTCAWFRNFFRCALILLFYLPAIAVGQNQNYTILCVAAHPDDEDGATLAYYSHIKGYNAYTIFLTRGEGGQNEIGPELYDELGKIREQETYRAAEILRSKALFLGFLDFGFSKTANETLKFWGGKDSVLARLVYMIRLIRPDVIISNHDTITTRPNRQHGHHQAAGITVYEAFDKARDPNFHPEQLTGGVTSWQVKKLYFRVYDTMKTNEIVTVPIQEKNASGKTIEEISLEALAEHRTQGMDKINLMDTPAPFRERKYVLIRSDKEYPFVKDDLFSGIYPDTKAMVTSEIKSYPISYSYIKANPEDSLVTLDLLKAGDGVYIGLISSYDNTLENILKAYRINFDFLDSNSLMFNDLTKYTTILIDIRAYFYRKDLSPNNFRILNFVRDGGNAVTFYHKPSDWNNKNLSPYPLYLTSERVTEEDAPVKLLYPDQRYFNIPNEMTSDSWIGWAQERNIYLPSGDTALTSSKYLRLLAASDEGDTVPPTSLLWAEYGAGTYTYCSLALYRQLKIFNYGALQLFLNMVSQPRRQVKGKYN